jgi:procollagen-lysine,2-oxoglutarate 5-dioxygenase
MFIWKLLILGTILVVGAHSVAPEPSIDQVSDFILFTVATEKTDGYKRFIHSSLHHKIQTKVLGMSEEWRGGDMSGRGGGQKVNHFRKALKPFRQDSRIVMFTDSYDVIVTGNAEAIIKRFNNLNANIVFSAEMFCWPDDNLSKKYPPTDSPYKYLNSGGIVGFAKDIYDLLRAHPIKDSDDDQLFYTDLFLNESLRQKYHMKLDNKAEIFQNLFGAQNDVELKHDPVSGHLQLYNTKFETQPVIVHGNGLSKVELNSLANYLVPYVPLSPELKTATLPTILIAAFVPIPTPFLEEFLKKIESLNYPKNKLSLYIYNSVEYHQPLLEDWKKNVTGQYASEKWLLMDGKSDSAAKNEAIEYGIEQDFNYVFMLESVAHLDNSDILHYLLQVNQSVVSPLLLRPGQFWSNFWGALNPNGFYARSADYMDIIHYDKKGIWNVPYISSSILIASEYFLKIRNAFTSKSDLDIDMSFCHSLRHKGVFMLLDNRHEYGHLVNPDEFQTTRMHPDLYELINNKYDWERRYIHPEFAQQLSPNYNHSQPCPDVYWFPIVTERFCKELIEVVENFGKWSSGSNYDERLEGGYENVPTRDIHMDQVGMKPTWLKFLQEFVRPLQETVFLEYYHNPPKAIMNFVVRYKPDEQPSLRPHHDSSTYTINLALNRPMIDYEGGGCRFIRYNCSVINSKIGWLLMHPGRLTHLHEGLPVTKGTRYIMISFVDP